MKYKKLISNIKITINGKKITIKYNCITNMYVRTNKAMEQDLDSKINKLYI